MKENRGSRGYLRPLAFSFGFLTPLSIFLPFLPSILTLATLLAIALAISSGATFKKSVLAHFAGGLAALALLSIFWSPEPALAVMASLYFALLALMVGVGANAESRHANLLGPIVAGWLLGAAVDAVLVIYFRTQPVAELEWFRSEFAAIFVDPGVLSRLFTNGYNNALDPYKSGAFFVNANTGSAMLGVALCLSLSFVLRGRIIVGSIYSLLFAVAIYASGSSTGLALLILTPCVILSGEILRTRLAPVLTPIFAVLLLASVYLWVNSISDSSDVRGRELLWNTAIRAIAEYPVTGLGYGGWESYAGVVSAQVGNAGVYPPHNIVLYACVQAGILLGALTLLFYGRAIWAASRGSSNLCLTMGVTWCLLHSMGDNTSIFNDYHTMPVLAILVGTSEVLSREKKTEEMRYRNVVSNESMGVSS